MLDYFCSGTRDGAGPGFATSLLELSFWNKFYTAEPIPFIAWTAISPINYLPLKSVYLASYYLDWDLGDDYPTY